MNEARIAVVGAGQIGRRHIEEISKNPGATISAIVDPMQGAAALARRVGRPLYDTLEACITADRPDGVVLATPNRLHVPQGLACIAAGIPVLIEKPLAHDLDEGERLVAAAEKVGARVLVGHHRLYSPLLRRTVEAVRAGILGRIVGVIGSAVFYKPDAYFDGPNTWRREPGAGPLLINMIHEIGNLRAMVGEIAAVQAVASNAVRGFPIEDTVAVTLRFVDGALGTFLLSDTAASARSWEQTSRENDAYPTYPDEDAYTILGTEGSLAVPSLRLKRYAKLESRSWFEPFACDTLPVERADPLAEQITHFVAVIRGEATPLVSARDGLQNLRVVDAIMRAARAGGTVEVPAG
ncbi:Gfo/Idh/MocA family oxidoreductase [Methylobacterium sp. 17Sr1-1]|uniref:Gfo/Idh/MocA family protein n=1 Tax=Methylobacterium sp. 17Sr1-1 TaxID=2202826 RepID=UPI000D6ED31A|nr:Gfo/Idh/MocA family oxidoreductase [Methylobacterium sp. 17Sr1-1]AWN55432.1 oxidoreductase [Methylobacterium sp. 17Sr1-1]